jgi:hypothetical protein
MFRLLGGIRNIEIERASNQQSLIGAWEISATSKMSVDFSTGSFAEASSTGCAAGVLASRDPGTVGHAVRKNRPD